MRTKILLAGALATCLMVPALAAAQDGNQGAAQRPAGPPPGQPRAGAAQGQNRPAPLTEEQRGKVKAVQEQFRKDAQAIRDRQRTARRSLQDALRTETLDEKAVKAAAAAAAAAQADMILLNRRRQAELKTFLSPQQLRRLTQAQRAMTQQRRAMTQQRRMMQRNRMNRPGRQMMGQPGRMMRGPGGMQGFGPGPGRGRQGQPGMMGPMMGPNQPGPQARRWRRWI